MYSLFKVIFGRNYKKSFVGTPEGFFAYHSWMKDLKNAQVMKKKNTKACQALIILGLNQVQF